MKKYFDYAAEDPPEAFRSLYMTGVSLIMMRFMLL